MHPVLRWLTAVAFVALLALGLQSAWAEWAPAAVRTTTGVVLSVMAIGWIVLRVVGWLASDDFEGEVWEREHALRSDRRP